ncbi:MAG: JAB domain-containing protein, partial [Verrucomicrobia bacterium]|nr:JAB domain-containing protein [Verrucomicrobiota bacterium]
IFKGTINECAAYPREIFRSAITHSSFGFVLLHNHPTGSVSPSSADLRLTKQLVRGAQLLKIRFLDHIIVGQAASGNSGYFSFKEAGLL